MTAYHRPTALDEALDLLAAGGLQIAAGCTDIYPATQKKTLPGPVLDLTAIDALRGISHDAKGWRIGATTTWTDILRADLPPAFDALKLAAREVGSVQIQNAGTVAGNLCTASPAADGAPCLMTLEAQVELRAASGSRRLPLQDFLTGARRTARHPNELVAAIHIPESAARGRSTFLKLGARKYLVISIAMVAARLSVRDGAIEEAAISVGACSPVAARLTALEDSLRDRPAAQAADIVDARLVGPALSPIDDIRADAAYRVAAATELTRRALARLTGRHMDRAA